jgi:hypothetical protein
MLAADDASNLCTALIVIYDYTVDESAIDYKLDR